MIVRRDEYEVTSEVGAMGHETSVAEGFFSDKCFNRQNYCTRR